MCHHIQIKHTLGHVTHIILLTLDHSDSLVAEEDHCWSTYCTCRRSQIQSLIASGRARKNPLEALDSHCQTMLN